MPLPDWWVRNPHPYLPNGYVAHLQARPCKTGLAAECYWCPPPPESRIPPQILENQSWVFLARLKVDEQSPTTAGDTTTTATAAEQAAPTTPEEPVPIDHVEDFEDIIGQNSLPVGYLVVQRNSTSLVGYYDNIDDAKAACSYNGTRVLALPIAYQVDQTHTDHTE